MGWSISYSPERDDSKVVYLDRPFSYELLKEYGCMRQFLTPDEAGMFYRNGEDEDAIGPETWEGGNPADFFDIFSRVREGLHSHNDLLPITHFLSYVNWGEYHDRDPLGGSTVINVPPGPRSYTYPHDPMIKLDGGHTDIEHRHELQRYSIRIDPEKLGPEWAKKQQESSHIHLIAGDIHVFGGIRREFDPIIEEPDGWIPVAPVIEVLGHQIKVLSLDVVARYGQQIDDIIACCKECMAEGKPIFWIYG